MTLMVGVELVTVGINLKSITYTTRQILQGTQIHTRIEIRKKTRVKQ